MRWCQYILIIGTYVAFIYSRYTSQENFLKTLYIKSQWNNHAKEVSNIFNELSLMLCYVICYNTVKRIKLNVIFKTNELYVNLLIRFKYKKKKTCNIIAFLLFFPIFYIFIIYIDTYQGRKCGNRTTILVQNNL